MNKNSAVNLSLLILSLVLFWISFQFWAVFAILIAFFGMSQGSFFGTVLPLLTFPSALVLPLPFLITLMLRLKNRNTKTLRSIFKYSAITLGGFVVYIFSLVALTRLAK